jgi:xanthine dehydrogenase accessory factor
MMHDDVDDSQLARVHAPIGLDLGRLENAEIAVAVLADLVARRAAGEMRPYAPPVPMATDPVCGMTVDITTAKYHAVHDGKDYWFCAAGCRREFERNPNAFAK